ncbi:MAG: hypothetical protein GY820_03910 [Gammaproteobacteria bacterium]|nr:hypothetical protein [Gammaproteobacteria bacterium]
MLVLIAVGIAYIHKDRVHITKSPPESLAQWYKPDNKRQVWLHNMFKLRREMQAVEFYASNGNAVLLRKWADSFGKHYLAIAEMVPEWGGKLDIEEMMDLQAAVSNNNFQDVPRLLKHIGGNCQSCHTDYRAIVATMYRAPDFSTNEISPSSSFNEHMKELIKQLNQIKIASEDGMKELSLKSLSNLKKGINELGQACPDCHKPDLKPYPDAAMVKTLANLEQSLNTGTVKDQGHALGTLAVQACARCHGTHRFAYDISNIFTDKPDWLELIRH